MAAFRELGVTITDNGSEVIVEGVGFKGLTAPQKALDMG